MPEKLNKKVTISRQFLRSINLEADLGRSDALDGYICQDTAKALISNMAHHLNETRQRAFTWTGPYGSGKSSLALALGSLVSSDKSLRDKATKLLNITPGSEISRAWSTSKDGWLTLPVVGKKDSVLSAISKALDKVEGITTKRPKATETISRLVNQAEQRRKDGVLVILDELGKFLESAAQTGEDIYFYQELAEAASRCKGKLVIVGVLHQAFEQYANKLGRDTRDEWAKVQGRYIDIPLMIGSDEVIELVGRAIETQSNLSTSKNVEKYASVVSNIITKRRPNAPINIKKSLLNCWPLHPVTAALLAPISRKRFSQNERSVFGFLASAEPLGFTDFLNSSLDTELSMYTPARYWDYLKANLEQAIIASPEGHRWAVANDAIERAEAREGCTEIHVQLAKTIALIDLFRSGSGIAAEDPLLEICINSTAKEIRAAKEDLARWSVAVFRKHTNAWAIYSGSDFDIDSAVNQARSELGELDIKKLTELSELNPIVAKKHYHTKGTLRWFSRTLLPLSATTEYLNTYSPPSGATGEFILVAPNPEFGTKLSSKKILELSLFKTNQPTILGFLTNSEKLFELGMELSSLERVQKSRRELDGDAVARKEINGRLSALRSELSDELKNSFETAEWFYLGKAIDKKEYKTLSSIASKLVDDTYPDAPPIHNELVNRESISANAVKARRELMYQMINKKGLERLGYDGYSADAGLFYSIIQHNNLYQLIDGEWRFTTSDKKSFGNQLAPLWETADQLLTKSKSPVTLREIYEKWQAPKIGARKGVLPIFALTYFLANRHNLGLYIENTFIPDLTEAFLDEWMQDTKRVAFKYVEIGKKRATLLKLLSQSLTESLGKPVADNPLESARGLVSIIYTLPNWAKRTSTISAEAQKIRGALLKASDPHKVLFSDLPNLLNTTEENELVEKITNLVSELQTAYPKLIAKFRSILYSAIDHQGDLAKLRSRAENILGMTGKFEINSFTARLSVLGDDLASIEGLLSTTINKNPKDWVDSDQEAAINTLGKFCATFRSVESLQNLRGQTATRKSFAFVYSDPKNKGISRSFDIAEEKVPALKKISDQLLVNLRKQGLSNDEILATFAQACSDSSNWE